MIWPFLLAAALIVWAWCAWRSDRAGEWVAGLLFVGVVLMQAPFPEPLRWLWAASLYGWIALAASRHTSVRKRTVAAIMAIPIGYMGLALVAIFGITLSEALGYGHLTVFGLPLSLLERSALFGLTEVPWVVALISGGWGSWNGTYLDLHSWLDKRRRRVDLHRAIGAAQGEAASQE